MRNLQGRGRAMELPKRTDFTADEFIAWALEQPAGRFELDNGAVFAMAPERASHATAKGNAFVALRTSIGARGRACQAFPDGMSVRIDEQTVYEPDALVRCGPRLPGDALEVNDPIVVVEVVSPSTRGVDRGVKLSRYFLLPSLRHYLIVDTQRRVIVHHRRGDADGIEARVIHGSTLTLDPPGLAIEVQDVFAGL